MAGWRAAARFRPLGDEERRDQRTGGFSVNEGVPAPATERFAKLTSIADAILPGQRGALFSACNRTMTSLTRDGAVAHGRRPRVVG
jgi:hypothetical protein